MSDVLRLCFAAVTYHELFKLAALAALKTLETDTWRELWRELDERCLQQAVDGIVRRHDSLRTVFIEADPFLNALMACDGSTLIKKMNLAKWATASPRFIVPDNMLVDAIERARRDVSKVKDQEWHLWADKIVNPDIGHEMVCWQCYSRRKNCDVFWWDGGG